MKKKKVSIAIALQQHSYKTAEVLKKNNFLNKYYTTVYYDRNSFLYKALEKFLNYDLKIRMKNRFNQKFQGNVSKYFEFIGLIYLFLIRIDTKNYILPLARRILNYFFGKKVSKAIIKDKTDILIMYDTLAYDCFKSLNKKKSKVIKVLDMASISASTIRDIVLKELSSDDIFKESLEIKIREYSKNLCNIYDKEIFLADYILVACKFSKNAIVNLGVNEKKIIYLPLGVDIGNFKIKQYYNTNKKLKFLFVGRVEAAKGIYYLLEAFNNLEDYNVELIVVGKIGCNDKLLSRYNKNIKFLGIKRKEEMPDIYKDCDVYILSSLWEGFSLSLFEALSSGLPVIASKNSCALDLITDYKEGFVIDPTNISELTNKMLWFCENRDKLSYMGKNAHELAKKYSWNEYSYNLTRIINKLGES